VKQLMLLHNEGLFGTLPKALMGVHLGTDLQLIREEILLGILCS
jgi:hypothetical protein